MTLLAAGEPAPYVSLEGAAADRIVFTCDHASNLIPAALGRLGLDDAALVDHIAWDIGAGPVARLLQQRFDAGAVIAGYSRLVVDVNRSLRDPSAFPSISDGILVPGNIGLSATDRDVRAAALHAPYHAAVDRLLASVTTEVRGPVLVAVHSFTPRFHGTRRSWDVGVLWDKDPRLAVPMLEALRSVAGIAVGDNEPYSGRHPADFTIDHHAEARGIAHVGIEIRQDLITDPDGQNRWADLISGALRSALSRPSVYERRPSLSGMPQ